MSIAIRLLVVFTLLLGLAYPVTVTLLGQLIWKGPANGSMLASGQGSALIGQNFSAPGDFWGRPSATAERPYNAASSSGSNWGPREPKLRAAWQTARRAYGAGAPVDLISASGSGLDPHITPEAAYYQAGRVARARNLPEYEVRQLIERHIEGPTFGVLGHARVNVVLLNQDLHDR